MNFLAHLWIADVTGTSMPGAILGDVVRGSDLSMFSHTVAEGIRLHRRIDAATDRHPLLIAARSGFADGERRYAGIVLDLACDFALATDWAHHHAEPMDAFCSRAAQAVADAAASFGTAGAETPEAHRFARLLQSYGREDGIEHALRRVATRLRRPEALINAARSWRELADALRTPLPDLLDDLRRLAAPQDAAR
jgi:acyl carrier protein phosphodiesterase